MSQEQKRRKVNDVNNPILLRLLKLYNEEYGTEYLTFFDAIDNQDYSKSKMIKVIVKDYANIMMDKIDVKEDVRDRSILDILIFLTYDDIDDEFVVGGGYTDDYEYE